MFSSVVVFRRYLQFVGVEFFFASFLVVGGMVFFHLLEMSSLVVAVCCRSACLRSLWNLSFLLIFLMAGFFFSSFGVVFIFFICVCIILFFRVIGFRFFVSVVVGVRVSNPNPKRGTKWDTGGGVVVVIHKRCRGGSRGGQFE